MQRIVYMARLQPDKVELYKKAHEQVPTKVIEEATECGIRNHSCFLRGRDLIIYLETDSYEETEKGLLVKPATQDWERRMAGYFDGSLSLQEPWEEVFHMD